MPIHFAGTPSLALPVNHSPYPGSHAPFTQVSPLEGLVHYIYVYDLTTLHYRGATSRETQKKKERKKKKKEGRKTG